MCGRFMTQWWGWYACKRCQVREIVIEEPSAPRQASWIDPDSGEEIPYIDHSEECCPSPA